MTVKWVNIFWLFSKSFSYTLRYQNTLNWGAPTCFNWALRAPFWTGVVVVYSSSFLRERIKCYLWGRRQIQLNKLGWTEVVEMVIWNISYSKLMKQIFSNYRKSSEVKHSGFNCARELIQSLISYTDQLKTFKNDSSHVSLSNTTHDRTINTQMKNDGSIHTGKYAHKIEHQMSVVLVWLSHCSGHLRFRSQ